MDGGYGWVVVLVSFLQHVVVIGMNYSNGVLFDLLLTTFGQGRGPTSWVSSLNTAMLLGGGVLSGMLIDRIGQQATIFIGGVGVFVSYLLTSFMRSLWPIFITHGIFGGLSSCLAWQACVVIIPQYFDKRRSTATGLAVSGAGAGTFIMAPVHRALLLSGGGGDDGGGGDGSDGSGSSNATLWCDGSAPQPCYMECADPSCLGGECARRVGSCCEVECIEQHEGIGWRNGLRVLGALALASSILTAWVFKPGPLYKKRPRPANCLGLDFGLWRIPLFRYFTISLLACGLGYSPIFVHLVRHAKDVGIEHPDSVSCRPFPILLPSTAEV
eukprot:COSAG04_NODE_28_length_36566_cov_70.886665_19_plen_328_part_00